MRFFHNLFEAWRQKREYNKLCDIYGAEIFPPREDVMRAYTAGYVSGKTAAQNAIGFKYKGGNLFLGYKDKKHEK